MGKKRGTFFWLGVFKGEPFPKKKKGRQWATEKQAIYTSMF